VGTESNPRSSERLAKMPAQGHGLDDLIYESDVLMRGAARSRAVLLAANTEFLTKTGTVTGSHGAV
jgi:hypothetical protein